MTPTFRAQQQQQQQQYDGLCDCFLLPFHAWRRGELVGGGLRGSVFGSGGAAGSPFAAGGLPTAQGASGLYKEAERMPGEMNRGLFGEGDESFNLPQSPASSNNARGGSGEDFSKLPWWSGITLSQVVIAASFLFTISLMLATAWFVNSVGAIRFNE